MCLARNCPGMIRRFIDNKVDEKCRFGGTHTCPTGQRSVEQWDRSFLSSTANFIYVSSSFAATACNLACTRLIATILIWKPKHLISACRCQLISNSTQERRSQSSALASCTFHLFRALMADGFVGTSKAEPGEVRSAVAFALRDGYRHIDAALFVCSAGVLNKAIDHL